MSKKPSAEARTISLFTGRTDLDGERTRDGTLGEQVPQRRYTDPLRGYKWQGNFSWRLSKYIRGSAHQDTIATIEPRGGKYLAHVRGGDLATLDTIHEARTYVERSLAESWPE